MSTAWYKKLGPGLLYAGAAVGVSHLVQSTAAGAKFGYGLVWTVIIANILKYPFFEFAPRYAASTGKSLLHGYQSLGKWSIYLFAAFTVVTMFIIQAAVSIVTAGLISEIFNWQAPNWIVTSVLLIICSTILLLGNYGFLDKGMKYVILLLSVTTIVALVAALQNEPTKLTEHLTTFSIKENAHLLFLITLVGWMPAPLDVSVWHSLWSTEKAKSTEGTIPLKSALFDFKIGYWGTMILAILFLALGASTIYGTGIPLAASGGAFAKQLITIYTDALGSWAYYIIAIAALTTMFSTTLTCLDAFPRVMAPTTKMIFPSVEKEKTLFAFWMLIVTIGSVLLIRFGLKNMKAMVDFATTAAFVTAPVIAILNYLAVTGKTMPEDKKPKRWLRIFSIIGIIYFIGFSIYFIGWIK
ncbi:Nramp family divalent metal transporter [Aquimarina agarilytica]|uniref:Nramp family divalent metal transporter n=1 Tax=Aquimarina agarilytica TaxID=1087449 RepID=UPI000289F1BD|nr:Nramp family divalent metal transporter [Aquimarina agarilytica]